MKKFLKHIEEKRGLWDNIHAKRRRIKAGSGERMRRPGSKGAPTAAAIKASQNESKDSREYDYEGDMAISQLKSVITNAKKLHDMLKPNTNLPEWVQSKITLAEDYIITAANYMEGELDEGFLDNLKAHFAPKPTKKQWHPDDGYTHVVHFKAKPGALFQNSYKMKVNGGTKEDHITQFKKKFGNNSMDNFDYSHAEPIKKPVTAPAGTQLGEAIVEGNNYGKPYNNVKDLESKSNEELRRLHDFWNQRIEGNPNHSRAKGQLAHIKRIRAERIGKKIKEEVEQLQERGANKYKRSTESGAGLTRAGVMKHRRENPGSKLSTAVTTPPSKLKKGSKAANRRKSFCARMSGVKGPMKDKKGRPTRKAMSLRRWNCN